jgi:hypothetical protein
MRRLDAPCTISAEAPRSSYAASEFRTKQWLSEAPIERWFPLYAQERLRFDAHGTVRLTPLNCVATEQPCVLATDQRARHVAERLATRDRSSSCHPDAGCHSGELRRSGGVCLDIHTYRKQAKPATLVCSSSLMQLVYISIFMRSSGPATHRRGRSSLCALMPIDGVPSVAVRDPPGVGGLAFPTGGRGRHGRPVHGSTIAPRAFTAN